MDEIHWSGAKQLPCQNCIDSLLGNIGLALFLFGKWIDKSGLIYSSKFVVKIVQFAEKVLNVKLKRKNGYKNIV